MLLFIRMGRKIIGEDAVLWPPVQQGLEASDHRGVLSAREERVYAFQRFVCEKLGQFSLHDHAGPGNDVAMTTAPANTAAETD